MSPTSDLNRFYFVAEIEGIQLGCSEHVKRQYERTGNKQVFYWILPERIKRGRPKATLKNETLPIMGVKGFENRKFGWSLFMEKEEYIIEVENVYG